MQGGAEVTVPELYRQLGLENDPVKKLFRDWASAFTGIGPLPHLATGKELDELMGLTDTQRLKAPCFACGKTYSAHQVITDRCPDPNGGWAAASTFVPRPPPAIPVAPPPRIDPERVYKEAALYDAQGRGAHMAVLLAICGAANRELEAAHKLIAEQGKKIELLLGEIKTVAGVVAEALPKKPTPPRVPAVQCYCGTTVVFQEFADAQLCSGCGKVHQR